MFSGASAGKPTEGRSNRLELALWWQLLRRVQEKLERNHVSMMSAGVAFYALLSIFPALSVLISLYGLVADRDDVLHQLDLFAGILPAEAVKLLADQMNSLIHAPPAKLGVGVVVSLSAALWSAMSGTTGLMQALTVASNETEDRGFLQFYLTVAGLTAGFILFGVFSLVLIAVIPALVDWAALPDFWRSVVSLIRWPILAGLGVVGLSIVYRLAPSRDAKRWISTGAIASTLLWIIGSFGFSLYVARFSSYDKTYGSLGAVVILLMWFYLTAYIILAGAELNAEIARSTASSGSRLRVHEPL
jgi:membrane protein